MKKVCVVTGSRAEYGLLKPVMEAIQKSEGLRLQLSVAGQHLVPAFGNTIQEIRADGFHVDCQNEMTPLGDTTASMGFAVSRGVAGFIGVFQDIHPDIVLILGDRTEAFAAAIAAMFCGKVIAHVHGGDKTRAGFDESMRHAITKLAHIHFAATAKSRGRILRMGERPEHVHCVGAPGLDDMPAQAFRRGPYAPIVVLFHPVSTTPAKAGAQMLDVLEAACSFKRRVVVIGSNNDAGWQAIRDAAERYADRIQWVRSLPRADYLATLGSAAVLVGNSSSGIIEGGYFGIPVVNIGGRQAGRERAATVIDVCPHTQLIAEGIHLALHNDKFRVGGTSYLYGDGHAALHIVKVLEDLEITPELIQKQFVD